MRTFSRSLFPLAVLLSLTGCPDDKDANERRVVVFFTTDEHSQLFASSPELDDFIGATVSPGALKGGVERRMTILKAQRDAAAQRGEKVSTLTLSSGDFSQGSLASAAWLATSPELAAMKAMGYDAVALGNHEFDLGAAALGGTIQAAGSALPPLVLSNLVNPAELAPIYGVGRPIAPYLVLTASNGLEIGIVSSMGVAAGTVAGAAPPSAFWDASATTTTAKFSSVAAKVQAAVNQVRGQGVDAVILLAHGGIGASPLSPGEDELLAQALTGVDLILSGHSHLFTPEPRIVYGSGKAVPVVQPKPYGQNVGKVELVFVDNAEQGAPPRPYLDPAGTQFFEVDDQVAKTTDAAFVTDLQTRTVGFLEFGLDGTASTTLPSFLEATLSRIGIAFDAGHTPGQLWNAPLGRLDYEVIGLAPGETNAMNLDTDAMLAAVRGAALVGIPPAACASCAGTEIAIQASGPIRGDLKPGTTGVIGFADVYHLVPLGGDPTAIPPEDLNPATNAPGIQTYLNTIPGYPLVKVNLPTAALKAALEGTISTGLFVNGDFFPGVSGLDVEWGLTGNAASPVAVKRMALANGTLLYDESQTGPIPPPNEHYFVDPRAPRALATTFYVASVALGLGIPIFDDAGTPIASQTDLAKRVVRRGNGSSIKDFESLAQFIAAQCLVNGGLLPDTYGGAVPQRVVCTGAGCPPGYAAAP